MNISSDSSITRRPTKFVNPVPESLKCPLCKSVFVDASISNRCGHTFCSECVRQTARSSYFSVASEFPSLPPAFPLTKTGKCPIDQILFQTNELIPNRAIREQVSLLLIHCQHGLLPSIPQESSIGPVPIESISSSLLAGPIEKWIIDEEGCSEIIEIGKRDIHESECVYAFISCTNNIDCDQYRKKDLDLHLKSCSFTKCGYSSLGCNFTGLPSEVETHEAVCISKSEINITYTRELADLKSAQDDILNKLEKLTSSIDALNINFTNRLELQHSELISLSVRVDAIETQMGGLLYGHLTKGGVSNVSVLDDRESSRLGSHTGASETINSHNGEWHMPFTLKCIGTFQGHKGNVTSLVSNVGYVISSSDDGQIKLWNSTNPTRGCYKTLEAHSPGVIFMAGDGNTLYSSGKDLNLCAWRIPNMELICRKENAHIEDLSAMLVMGSYLVTAISHSLKIWQIQYDYLVEVNSADKVAQKIRALTYDKRKGHVYSGAHNTIHMWQGDGNFTLKNKIESQSFSSIYSLATTPQFLIVGTYNQNVQVLDIETYQHCRTLTGHIGSITCLLTTPQGGFVFSGSHDTTVQLWNLENMLPIQIFQRHEAPVTGLVLHNDWFFSASEEKEIKVFKRVKT